MSSDEKVKSGANIFCLISRILHLLLESPEPFLTYTTKHNIALGFIFSILDVYLDMVSARLVVTIGPTVNCVVTGDVSRWE